MTDEQLLAEYANGRSIALTCTLVGIPLLPALLFRTQMKLAGTAGGEVRQLAREHGDRGHDASCHGAIAMFENANTDIRTRRCSRFFTLERE
jgi:hypothetical protein